jgi:FlaA1/EpsC-like NDP-sugar epimerase
LPPTGFTQALLWLPLLMVSQGGAFIYFGLYRGDWRFASMPDLLRIIKAVTVGTLACMAIIFLFTRLQGIPRSVFPAYWLLLIVGLGTPRFFYRWIKDRKLYLGQGERVLIAGAGRAGEMLARDLLRDPQRTLEPVGFVDDSKHKRGADIHGIRVLGNCDQLPDLVNRLEVDIVLLAIPSASSPQIRRIVEYCEAANVTFRTIPCMQDLIAGRVSINTLREVSIEDLLGRDPVRLDREAIRTELSGRCVLISGGGGSIGTELCRSNCIRCLVMSPTRSPSNTCTRHINRTSPTTPPPTNMYRCWSHKCAKLSRTMSAAPRSWRRQQTGMAVTPLY